MKNTRGHLVVGTKKGGKKDDDSFYSGRGEEATSRGNDQKVKMGALIKNAL